MSQIRNPPRKDDPLAGDLSDFIAANRHKFKRLKFVFAPKDTTVTIRMPEAMVESAKKVAKRKGVKYQALLRDAIAGFLVKEGE